MSDDKKQEITSLLEMIKQNADIIRREVNSSDEINRGYIRSRVSLIKEIIDDMSRYYQDGSISFWLKFCEPLPEVDESALKPREWQIDASEVEGRD